MTYEQVSKFRISRTYQYGDRFIEEKLLSRQGRIGSQRAIWSFPAAGIPIYSRSPENKTQAANSGEKRGIYRQAPHEPDFSCQAAFESHRGIIKHYCYTSSQGISQKTGAWVRGVVKGNCRCFTVLIGWPIARFHKSIGCWFLRRCGLAVGTRQI